MNSTPRILAGCFAVFLSAWLSFVVYSYAVLGHLAPEVDANTGDPVPPPFSGLAAAGQKVYVSQGCVSCHSQSVRPAYIAPDIEKNLGPRRTVARDFLRDQPALVGRMRIGPDLANYGLRAPALNEIHRHLIDPRAFIANSNMPSFRYLYREEKISGQQADDAITGLSENFAPKPGHQLVPTEDARLLAAYLLSLKRDYPLPEAPIVSEKKK